VAYRDQDGRVETIEAQHVISPSAPMRELARGLTPPMSKEAKNAAESLKYRDFLTVMLILKERHMFDDNWIYIHDPSVQVTRDGAGPGQSLLWSRILLFRARSALGFF
jgi:protoporphyrinogen oxidase